jgi:hypothetical protein
MTKVVVKDLRKSLPKGGRGPHSEKRINSEGKLVEILTIDSNSPYFSSDLHSVFQKNVAKARRENKKRFGSPDRVSQKS